MYHLGVGIPTSSKIDENIKGVNLLSKGFAFLRWKMMLMMVAGANITPLWSKHCVFIYPKCCQGAGGGWTFCGYKYQSIKMFKPLTRATSISLVRWTLSVPNLSLPTAICAEHLTTHLGDMDQQLW